MGLFIYHCIFAFILYAVYDLFVAYKLNKDVPGITIENDIKSLYWWKYQGLRLLIITILCLIFWKLTI